VAYGPVEILVVKFPGIESVGRVAPALAELTATMQIRLVEILYAIKERDGTLSILDSNGMGYSSAMAMKLTMEIGKEALSRQNAERVSILMESNSVAVLLLFENVWTSRYTEAMRRANENVIRNARMPREVFEFASSNSSTLVAR
jgi:hypothetical protein